MKKGHQFIIDIKSQYFYEKSQIIRTSAYMRLSGKRTTICNHSYFPPTLDIFMKNIKSPI